MCFSILGHDSLNIDIFASFDDFSVKAKIKSTVVTNRIKGVFVKAALWKIQFVNQGGV